MNTQAPRIPGRALSLSQLVAPAKPWMASVGLALAVGVAISAPTSDAGARHDEPVEFVPVVSIATAVSDDAAEEPLQLVGFPTLEGSTFEAPSHTWRSLFGSSWQIVSEQREDPALTDRREGNRDQCPAGMVHVQGRMKVGDDIEQLQLQTCTSWLNRYYPERCADFDRDAWRALSVDLPTEAKDFCMDRFEYPNVAGQYPLAHVSYDEAADLCTEQGKRLCGEDEWTFACEGEEAQPYGYGDGYTRDADACVIDRTWREHHPEGMAQPGSLAAALEMDRMWQGEPSGANAQCKSPTGVYDMTGNVDEYTTSARATGRRSILKGGYWGPVRARCRPSTRSHGTFFEHYQQGFRCCADTPKAQTANTLTSS